MKRSFSWLAIGLLTIILIVLTLTCIRPPAGRFDFNLRMNEVSCLRQGVDPFEVWSEKIVLPPYRSNLPKQAVLTGCDQLVNAYVPWAYTFMLPFSYVPRSVAWFVYCLLMGLSMYFILRLADSTQEERTGRILVSAAPFLLVSYLLWSNVSVGNFIVFVLAASVAMAWMLSRGHDVGAGFLWALAMLKPQSAILFAIPLLIRGKWKTCFVAGMTCLVMSIVPWLMCKTSFVDLLLEGPAANAELFEGCGTWPKCLCGLLSRNTDIAVGLLVGLVLCVWMTWMVRKEKNWLVVIMPAAICGASWTYTQAYSHAMGWFVAYVLIAELLMSPRSKFLWALTIIAVPVLTRAFLAAHGFCAYYNCPFPMSEYAFRVADSINSTLSIVIAILLCVRIHREG